MLMVSFYLLACTFSVLAVYQAQNNHHTRVEVLGFNDQQLANYANKAALLNLNGGRLTLLEEKGARQLAIVNSRWYLSFQQPVYVVFTSLLFFIFTFLFVITGSVVCRNMQQKLAVALKPVQKLENWANSVSYNI